MTESYPTVASRPEADSHSSPSPSILTLPGSAASSDDLPKELTYDDGGNQHYDLLPGGVVAPEQGRKSPLIFEEKNSDFHDKGNGPLVSDTQASSMHFVPLVEPTEHEKPNLDIGGTVVTLPSPFSPSETIRPMTPPFPIIDNDPESPQPSHPPVEADDDRKPSESVTGTAMGTNTLDESSFLFPPIPFPDLRRYSLADLGSVGEVSSRGRRTLSDVGAIATGSRLDSEGTAERATARHAPGSDSRPSSRTSSARFSTFAEMGIQSFAMAKGEKTIESRKKEAMVSKKRQKKDVFANLNRRSPRNVADADAADADAHEQGADDVSLRTPSAAPVEVHGNRKTHKTPKIKSAGCIIM